MMKALLLVCFIFTQLTTSQDIDCNYASYGTLCALNTKAHVTRGVGNLVLVGSTNVLLVFSLEQPGLQFNKSIALPIDSELFSACIQEVSVGVDCQNHVLTILAASTNSMTLVCSSYSFNPTCTFHDLLDPSEYTRIPGYLAGYSPFQSDNPIVSIVTTSGHFFSATLFMPFAGVELKVAFAPFLGNTSFTAGTSQDNFLLLNNPTMSSAHEYGEHVYFFLYERDVETTEIVARAVRICITDDGIPSAANPNITVFRTFQKARIECSTGEGLDYNFLVSTSLVEREGTTPVIYGAFNPPLNGPPGAAICKFSFDQRERSSIAGVFGNTSNRVLENGGWQTYTEPTVYSCPGSPGNQRATNLSETHILKATSISSTPLYLHSQFLTKITVEELVYDGNTQEILYLATLPGDIVQVILFDGSNFRYELYSAQGNNPTIHSLFVYKVSQVEERNIIAATDNNVIHISRGQCYCYIDCFTCFDSKDPYCSWDPNNQLCINKILYSEFPELVETFTAEESATLRYCGPRRSRPVVTGPLFPCTPGPPPVAMTRGVTTLKSTEETTTKDPSTTEVVTPLVVSAKLTIQESYTALVSIGTGLYLAICVAAMALAVYFQRFKLKKDANVEPEFSSPQSQIGADPSSAEVPKEPPAEFSYKDFDAVTASSGILSLQESTESFTLVRMTNSLSD